MSSDYSMMVADIDTLSTKIFEGQKAKEAVEPPSLFYNYGKF